jgi:hypothetical protein
MSLLTRDAYLRAIVQEPRSVTQPNLVIATFNSPYTWPNNSKIAEVLRAWTADRLPVKVIVGLPNADRPDYAAGIERLYAVTRKYTAIQWYFTRNSHAKYALLHSGDKPIIGWVGSVNLSDSLMLDLAHEVRGGALRALARINRVLFATSYPAAKLPAKPVPPDDWPDKVMRPVYPEGDVSDPSSVLSSDT